MNIYMNKEVQVLSGKMKMISNEETKRQIVKESYDSGISLNQFAKQKGISPATLCIWRKKYLIENIKKSSVTENLDLLRSENEALKRELIKIKAYLGHKLYEYEGNQIG